MFIDSGAGKWTRALGSLVFLQLKVCFKSFVSLKCNSSPDSLPTARDLNHQQFLVLAIYFPQGPKRKAGLYYVSVWADLGQRCL